MAGSLQSSESVLIPRVAVAVNWWCEILTMETSKPIGFRATRWVWFSCRWLAVKIILDRSNSVRCQQLSSLSLVFWGDWSYSYNCVYPFVLGLSVYHSTVCLKKHILILTDLALAFYLWMQRLSAVAQKNQEICVQWGSKYRKYSSTGCFLSPDVYVQHLCTPFVTIFPS